MQFMRSIGLDLPQKKLVWEDENGIAHISYNDPQFLKKKHHLSGNEEELSNISNALEMLAKAAGEIK
jgi:uncharacterized protein (DUF302 family)